MPSAALRASNSHLQAAGEFRRVRMPGQGAAGPRLVAYLERFHVLGHFPAVWEDRVNALEVHFDDEVDKAYIVIRAAKDVAGMARRVGERKGAGGMMERRGGRAGEPGCHNAWKIYSSAGKTDAWRKVSRRTSSACTCGTPPRRPWCRTGRCVSQQGGRGRAPSTDSRVVQRRRQLRA